MGGSQRDCCQNRFRALLGKAGAKGVLEPLSYPNVHTDEGRKKGKGDGKELCDLLVVFGNHVLIFSDKACAFPDHPDIKVAWGAGTRARSISR